MGLFQSIIRLDLLKFIHRYTFQNFYLNLEAVLRIFLIIPVTTGTCKKSFSKLKIIKTIFSVHNKSKSFDQHV